MQTNTSCIRCDLKRTPMLRRRAESCVYPFPSEVRHICIRSSYQHLVWEFASHESDMSAGYRREVFLLLQKEASLAHHGRGGVRSNEPTFAEETREFRGKFRCSPFSVGFVLEDVESRSA